MTMKYVIRSAARQNGKTVSFMPKPNVSDNGGGMHVHYSPLSKDGNNLVALGKDRDFLEAGGVLTDDFIGAYIALGHADHDAVSPCPRHR